MQRILVVEDHEGHRTFLCKLLNAQGYRCEAARDGLEALEKLQDTEVDVVLTDLEMPRMNGLDLAQYLARRSERPIPTVLLTSWPTDEVRNRARNAGVQATFGKPYDFQELLAAIDQAIGANGQSDSPGKPHTAGNSREWSSRHTHGDRTNESNNSHP